MIVLIIVAIVIVSSLIASRRKAMTGTWTRAGARARDEATAAERAKRAKEIEAAAFVAAEDDPDFAPATVVGQAEQLFRDVQRAWDAQDIPALERMVGPDLLVEWRRRLDDFAGQGLAQPRRRARDRGRVRRHDATCRPRMTTAPWCASPPSATTGWSTARARSCTTPATAAARPTCASTGRSSCATGKWSLQSIEQDAEGEHNLTEPLVSEQGDDVAGMRDETVVEQAVADRAPAGADFASLTPLNFPDDALAGAREMALVDQRFEPDVIEVAVRRALEAWSEAVDGEDAPLLAISAPVVVNELLYGGDPSGRTRVVVRGPRLEAMRVLHVDGHSSPADGGRGGRHRGRALRGGPRHRERRAGRPAQARPLHPAARPRPRGRPREPVEAGRPAGGGARGALGSGGRPTEEDPMDDASVSDHIEALVAEEHRLLEHDPGTPEHRERLEAVRVELDRYWDLLRQRRGREEFGLDTDSTSLRGEDTVEEYEQ